MEIWNIFSASADNRNQFIYTGTCGVQSTEWFLLKQRQTTGRVFVIRGGHNVCAQYAQIFHHKNPTEV